jgi:hypothetical protein
MRIHERVGSPFGRAQTALSWGQLLLDRDPERSQTLLATAVDLAARYRFRDIDRRARVMFSNV